MSSRAWLLPYGAYLMALPQMYGLLGMLIEVHGLVSIFCRRILSFANNCLDGMQQFFQCVALIAPTIMDVVACLPHELVTGITHRVNTTVIRNARLFNNVDLAAKGIQQVRSKLAGVKQQSASHIAITGSTSNRWYCAFVSLKFEYQLLRNGQHYASWRESVTRRQARFFYK